MVGYGLDFPIAFEGIPVDDETLLQMHQTLLNEIEQKENQYLDTSRSSNRNNYLYLAVARLAYGFAKEEYESVIQEMKRRGLAVAAS